MMTDGEIEAAIFDVPYHSALFVIQCRWELSKRTSKNLTKVGERERDGLVILMRRKRRKDGGGHRNSGGVI